MVRVTSCLLLGYVLLWGCHGVYFGTQLVSELILTDAIMPDIDILPAGATPRPRTMSSSRLWSACSTRCAISREMTSSVIMAWLAPSFGRGMSCATFIRTGRSLSHLPCVVWLLGVLGWQAALSLYPGVTSTSRAE